METTIDLNRIATFVRVIEAGSFTAAARGLALPVSSVSRSVARLEDELGVRLLHRTTRKLALTEPGRQYFQRMQGVIGEARAATEAITGHAQAPRGKVRITMPSESGLLGLAPILADIVRRHPGLELDMTVSTRTLDLIEDGIDLAIRGGDLQDSTLIARRVGSGEFIVVAAPAYIERRGKPRTLADLERHDCIRFRSRFGMLPWRLTGPGSKHDPNLTGPLICDDLGLIHQMAVEGAGLALLPVQLVHRELSSRRLLRVLPRHAFQGGALYVVWPSQRLLPARVALVRDLLIQGLSEQKA